MFNSAQKEDFIISFTQSENRRMIARMVFTSLEDKENIYGDLCTWPKDILEPSVNEIIGFRSGSRRTRVSIIKAYIKWCKDNGVPDVSDAIQYIGGYDVEKFKSNTLSSPAHLQEYLDAFLDPVEDKTVDLTFRGFYWLIYLGIKPNDALTICDRDVDLYNERICFNQKYYPIYKEALTTIKYCTELTDFRLKMGKNSWKERCPGDEILRNTRTPPKLLSIRPAICNKFKKFKELHPDYAMAKMDISPYRAWISGELYRINEREKAGEDISKIFREMAISFLGSDGSDKVGRHDRKTYFSRLSNISSGYRTDYERWKEVYGK